MSILTRNEKTDKIIYTHIFLSNTGKDNKALFYTDLHKEKPTIEFPGFSFKYTQYATKLDSAVFNLYKKPITVIIDYEQDLES